MKICPLTLPADEAYLTQCRGGPGLPAGPQRPVPHSVPERRGQRVDLAVVQQRDGDARGVEPGVQVPDQRRADAGAALAACPRTSSAGRRPGSCWSCPAIQPLSCGGWATSSPTAWPLRSASQVQGRAGRGCRGSPRATRLAVAARHTGPPKCMSYRMSRSSRSVTMSSSAGPAARIVTPWAPRGAVGGPGRPDDPGGTDGRARTAITVSGCSPCLSSAPTPVMSMLGQTTLADESGPRVAPTVARCSRHCASSRSAGVRRPARPAAGPA